MGVGGPGDFVAPLNRFPTHNQWVTKLSNARFVAKLTEPRWFLSDSRRSRACLCRILPVAKNKRVSPHVLRHSTAMDLLQHGVDRSVIALWLGHESMDTTQVYLHASLALKEQALAKTDPLQGRLGRYRPSDKLLAFLQAL